MITRTTCFQVRGTTLAQIQASIDEEGPRVNDYRRAGATRWRVRWSYRAESDADGCRVKSAKVTVTATYSLPGWTDAGRSEATVVESYEEFASDVVRHERVHRRIAMQAGDAVRRTVLATPGAATCDLLQQDTRARVGGVMAEYRAKQVAFDRREAGA